MNVTRRPWFLLGVVALLAALWATPLQSHLDVAGVWTPVTLFESEQTAAAVPGGLALASPLELALLHHVNVDRASNGLPPLELEPGVLDIARERAATQLSDQPLSHYDDSGELAFLSLLMNSGVDFSLAGENLARATSADPAIAQRVQHALMRSPTHRQNILEPAFTRLTVGVAVDEAGRVAFAQIFLAAGSQ